MKENCSENKIISKRQGTTQEARYLESLYPENIELMGLGVADWVTFAEKFAKHINYFDVDETISYGNWESFFTVHKELREFISEYAEGEITPHFALYICFLKLLEQSKKRFNTITKRHLDFYYTKVLKLQKKAAQPDEVYALFQLTKNIYETQLKENTLLDASKDNQGNSRHYALSEELIVNNATISELKNIYEDTKGWYASTKADSVDGKEIGVEGASWMAFGDTTRDLATVGFTVGTPSLKLSEGPRKIVITVTYNSLKDTYNNSINLASLFEVAYTTKKEWKLVDFKDGSIKILNNKLIFTINLEETDDAFTSYDKDIHQGKYQTDLPLLRIYFKQDKLSDKAYGFYKYIVDSDRELLDMKLTTESIYSENMEVKNDLGLMNIKDPFYPFGPLAKRNANFMVGSEEWVGKRIVDISLILQWKDRPINLESYYEGYTQDNFSTFSIRGRGNVGVREVGRNLVIGANGENRFIVTASTVENHRLTFDKATTIGTKGFYDYSIVERDKAIYEEGKYDSKLNFANEPSSKQNPKQLFDSGTKSTFNNFITTPYIPNTTDAYFLKLTLKNDFLHSLYPKIYTYQAMKSLELPNEPYTPLAEHIQVVVKTEERFSKTDSEITLFHEHPFGVKEEIFSSRLSLMPVPETGGVLYLGIDNARAKENIQLLFQLEEGTENPDPLTNTEKKEIIWYYLDKNNWEPLKPKYLLKDELDDFLKTGLVKFTVPSTLNKTTLFEDDRLWIKIVANKRYDKVARIINIHTQAVKAVFADNNNVLDHLENGLQPKTISKLDKRISTIKKVEQPYASFNGKIQESDSHFYRRISERLRHKNRAITAWDYEHLTLERFNYLHKVKCLNHSTVENFTIPGEVLMVVVPNVKNQNVFNIYEPKLSLTKLNDIERYINKLNTMFVNAKVTSPVYELVQVDLEVVFYKEYDPNFYEKKLQQDIAQYLAPWAFDKEQPILFGNILYQNELVFYIENLVYVDYIKNIKLKHNGKTGKKEIIPTSQKSILTSVAPELHGVKAIEFECIH